MSSSTSPELVIGNRRIGVEHAPYVVPEIGINHEGDMDKARRMVDDAAAAGAETVKFQSHSPSDEMIPNDVVPANADISIWDIISRCTLTWDQEKELKAYTDAAGLEYLSTPFSREAADHLHSMDVAAYKIGSGECNNVPLIDHIASFGKPVILSTGMNDMASIAASVEVLRDHHTPYALLHCTSLYPTPRDQVRLGAIAELRDAFPDAVIGLSDHTLSNHVALGAVALGASILERHFTSDASWPGPDIEISMTPDELADLVRGSRYIHEAMGGTKGILAAEQPTIDFAYSSVVTLRPIRSGEKFDKSNVWVKRPGTGEILAPEFNRVVGSSATIDLPGDHQLRWSDVQS
ncbi:MAG: N-acetylneuraminate synthase family protein [Microthrixaceae bacterium]